MFRIAHAPLCRTRDGELTIVIILRKMPSLLLALFMMIMAGSMPVALAETVPFQTLPTALPKPLGDADVIRYQKIFDLQQASK